MAEALLNTLYGLRTHPFAPNVDSQGGAINLDVLGSPLDPRTDERLLNYYFDLYDWTRCPELGSLTNLLAAAHAPGCLDRIFLPGRGPLMVLISGFDGTGRESFLNLLLLALAKRFASLSPIEVELADLAHEGNVLSVAQYFLAVYSLLPPAPSVEDMSKTYDALTKTPIIGPDTCYHNLFQVWKARIPASVAPVFTLVLRGQVNRDTWRVLYNSSSRLFPIIIALTHQEEYAESCYRSLLRDGRNVVLIRAPYLDESQTESYLKWSLERERIAVQQDKLFPFENSSIRALFERGTQMNDSRKVTFPLTLINRTFRKAIDLKLLEMSSLDETQAATAPARLIGKDNIAEARRQLNQGR